MNHYQDFAAAVDKANNLFSLIPKGKKAILILGTKNSGKTTLTYPLCQLPLKAVQSSNSYDREYIPVKQYQDFEVNFKSNDTIHLPNIRTIPSQPQTYIVDIPHLFDRKDQNRLIGYYYFTRAMGLFERIKIVLTVSTSSSKHTSLDDCVEFISQYFRGSMEEMKHSLWMCISKVLAGTVVEKISKDMKEYWNEHETVLSLINTTLKNDHIFLFYLPHQPALEYSEFEPLLEDQYWSVPKTFSSYMDYRHLTISQLTQSGRQYHDSLLVELQSITSLYFDLIQQPLTDSFISSSQIQKAAKIVKEHSYYKFQEYQEQAILIDPNNDVACRTNLPIIKSHLKRMVDIQSAAQQVEKVLDLAVSGIQEIKDQTKQMVLKLAYVLKMKLIEMEFVSFACDQRFNLGPFIKRAEEILGSQLFTIKIKKEESAQYYLNRISTLHSVQQSEYLNVKECYTNLIEVAKEPSQVLKYSFELLKLVVKYNPKQLQLITLYERVGDLLLAGQNASEAIHFYTATFNYNKVLNVIQFMGLGAGEICEVGEFFIRQGFEEGIQLLFLALEQTHNVSEKILVSNKILDAERNREAIRRKLRERVQTNNLVYHFELSDDILKKKSTQSTKTSKFQKILKTDQDLMDILQKLERMEQELVISRIANA